MATTDINSNKIVKHRGCNVVRRVEPSPKSYTVMEVNVILQNRKALMSNYRLYEGAIDVLMKMVSSWVNDQSGVTIYGLCTNAIAERSFVSATVHRLIEKGLVEKIGDNKRTKLYAPTGECLQLMRKYFNLRDCA